MSIDGETRASTSTAELGGDLPAAEFLYHICPLDMRGEVLYPLNRLRDSAPDVYELQVAKYAGRERVLEFRIPLLEVLWNDVIHLSPIHPRRLAQAWTDAGLTSPSGWRRRFFRLPVERIAGLPAVWFASESMWVNNSPYEEVPLAPPANEFTWFDPHEYRELQATPVAYPEYLRAQIELGRRPLLFPKIPHILVEGEIDTTGLDMVDGRPLDQRTVRRPRCMPCRR